MVDLEALDLNWLRALSHLLETGSVTQAAQRAGVGQPAMSRTLAHLRRVTGDPLLVQSGRSWLLTERAEHLRPLVRNALAAVRDVLRPEPPFDPRRSEIEAAFAANDYAAKTLLLPWFQRVRPLAPKLRIRIQPIGSSSLHELLDGTLDFAIGPRLEAGQRGLSELVVRELARDHFLCAMRRGHPGANKRWSLKTFLGCEHLIVTTGRPGPAAVDAALAARGLRRKVSAIVPAFSLVPGLIERSNLLATLPAGLFADAPQSLLLRAPPLALPELPLYLAWHPRSTANARHRWLRDTLLAAASDRARENVRHAGPHA